MHQLIYALVQASTEEQALQDAHCVFDRLVGCRPEATPVFDYYVTFDDRSSRCAGPARWGDLPVAVPAGSPRGAELIERGWKDTLNQFERNLGIVQDAIAQYSTEEIMQDTDLVRHAFYNVGRYQGPTIALYDGHGCGIRHRRQLNSVLERENIWVVPADVHY
ncbi:hypothetical protein [Haloarchaeobius amylolyticus]|uniref:hypothetical protein n=1 Tax=Haloarchaeobius amylolyticus TaxID=1198296 RepID=UPI002270AB00|nr:hypothetical protein [Haloarchaeobius amylolyticus]